MKSHAETHSTLSLTRVSIALADQIRKVAESALSEVINSHEDARYVDVRIDSYTVQNRVSIMVECLVKPLGDQQSNDVIRYDLNSKK